VQHPRTSRLRKETCSKGSNGASRTSCASNEANGGCLNVAWYEARKDCLCARVDWPEEETQEAHCDCIANDIGDEPGEEMQCECSESKYDDEFLFPDQWCSVGEDEAAKSDAALGIVSNFATRRK
jgi:hypothetical protein